MTLLELMETFRGRVINGRARINLEGLTIEVKVIDFRVGAYQRIDARVQSLIDSSNKWIDASRLMFPDPDTTK